ncbi:MAG: hypothetical protein WCF18_06535 [Chthoniobacteraceae bacterium]
MKEPADTSTTLASAPHRRVQTAEPAQEFAAPRTNASPRRTAATPQWHDDEEDGGFLERNRTALVVGGFLLAAAGWFVFPKPVEKIAAVAKAPDVPPFVFRFEATPKPTPTQIATPAPRLNERKPERIPDPKPTEDPAPNQPPQASKPAALTTTTLGGPALPGLVFGHGSGGTIGGDPNGKGSGGGGSAYAAAAKARVQQVLSNDPKLKHAPSMEITFTITVDGSGRIIAVKVNGSSADQALLDQLEGLQLPAPPPGQKRFEFPMKLKVLRG